MPIIQNFTAGVNWQSEVFGADYPAPSFSTRLLLRGAAALEIPGTAASTAGAGWTIKAPASVTNNFLKGNYAYFLQAADLNGGVFAIESGNIEIAENPANMLPGDYRTATAIMLEAVEAKLANKATLAQESYKIGNREIRYVPLSQLIALRNSLKKELAQENAEKSGTSGGGGSLEFIPVFLER
jgi:hypothetical protein